MKLSSSNRRVVALTAAGALVAGVGVYRYQVAHAAGLPNDVPVSYTGRLTDNGTAVSGMRTIGVSLYATSSASTPLCNAASADTSVVDGHFRRTFESSCKQAMVNSAIDLHVEVFVQGSSIGGRTRVGAVPYSVAAAHSDNGVPVGGIIDWWRPASSVTLPPPGFVICDGAQVNDSESPYNGLSVPDLRNVFVRGVGLPSEIGTTGGSNTHGHTLDLPAHDHTVALNHDHASVSSSTAGAHNHLVLSFNGSDWFGGNGSLVADWDDGMDAAGSGIYPLVSSSQVARDYYSDTASGHAHSVDIAAFAGSATSGTHDPAPQATSTTSNVPAYFGLLKIIRIK